MPSMIELGLSLKPPLKHRREGGGHGSRRRKLKEKTTNREMK